MKDIESVWRVGMKEESSSCFLLNRSLEYLSSEPISFLFDSNIHDSEMNVNSFLFYFY